MSIVINSSGKSLCKRERNFKKKNKKIRKNNKLKNLMKQQRVNISQNNIMNLKKQDYLFMLLRIRIFTLISFAQRDSLIWI